MSLKTVIITGANSGIGLAASHQLAARGARVVMACRNKERGESACEAVKSSSHNPHVYFVELDTSSKASVTRCAGEILSRWPVIDALIHNAATFDISQTKGHLTEDGVEYVWATNYLGPWLLTRLLLEALSASKPGRVIDISSKGLLAKPFLSIEPNKAASVEDFSPQTAYYRSKLAMLTHTMTLAREHDPRDLVSLAVWVPAVKVASDRIPPLSPLMKKIYMLKRRFALEPEEMAPVYVALALDDAWKDRTGVLVDEHLREVKPPGKVFHMDAALELERITQEQLQL